MPKISRIRIIEPQPPAHNVPPAFDADLAWVQKRGVEVERQYQEPLSPDLAHTPRHPLPLVLVDGNIALSGRYPTREEMGIWMMFGVVFSEDKNTGGTRCCTL
ncbi:arsenic metallochaperone ArsD family protein [Oxalobacter sp. OttesenSCG-928-P03]|nr:arsenic metallochaperone ArsD family protein [Oxalobacter sp. OttesenSCG-928-P03]